MDYTRALRSNLVSFSLFPSSSSLISSLIHAPAVGINGHLPNLDYLNLVNRVLSDGQIIMLESERKAAPILPLIQVSGNYPVIHEATDFVKTLLSLFFMMQDQAFGLPTAEHGLFHK
jgi:hypothetical protein